MLFNTRINTVFFLIAASIFLLGCSPVKPVASIYVTPQCIATQSQCLIDSRLGQFQLLFNVEKVTSEQEFQIIVQGELLPKDLQVDAYLEGKNMYMGKIPLFFRYDAQHNYYVSDAILGSCSEPEMIWSLNLTLASPTEPSSQTFFITFTSTRI